MTDRSVIVKREKTTYHDRVRRGVESVEVEDHGLVDVAGLIRPQIALNVCQRRLRDLHVHLAVSCEGNGLASFFRS